MVYRYETFWDDNGIVVLQSLKVSHLSIIPNRFYESSKLKNWMCELCTVSQMQSQLWITASFNSCINMLLYRCRKMFYIGNIWNRPINFHLSRMNQNFCCTIRRKKVAMNTYNILQLYGGTTHYSTLNCIGRYVASQLVI